MEVSIRVASVDLPLYMHMPPEAGHGFGLRSARPRPEASPVRYRGWPPAELRPACRRLAWSRASSAGAALASSRSLRMTATSATFDGLPRPMRSRYLRPRSGLCRVRRRPPCKSRRRTRAQPLWKKRLPCQCPDSHATGATPARPAAALASRPPSSGIGASSPSAPPSISTVPTMCSTSRPTAPATFTQLQAVDWDAPTVRRHVDGPAKAHSRIETRRDRLRLREPSSATARQRKITLPHGIFALGNRPTAKYDGLVMAVPS